MALGVEKKWVGAFQNIYSEPPSWYQGGFQGGVFYPMMFVNSLDNMTARAGSVMASAPRSSGSSGFGGGGSSGGGFGGGGGGGFYRIIPPPHGSANTLTSFSTRGAGVPPSDFSTDFPLKLLLPLATAWAKAPPPAAQSSAPGPCGIRFSLRRPEKAHAPAPAEKRLRSFPHRLRPAIPVTILISSVEMAATLTGHHPRAIQRIAAR